MSTIKLIQRLRELAHAIENCQDDDELDRINDEIYEIEQQLQDEDDDHYGHKQDFR